MVTFTVNYYDIFHYNIGGNNWWFLDHLWTISVEEQFYLIFPFLFLFLPRHRLITELGVCIVLGPIFRTLLTQVLNHLPVDDSFKFGTICGFAPAHFDAFSAGALLALFRPFLASRLDLARVFGAIALGAAVVYICVYVSINVATLGFHQAALKGVVSHSIWGQGRQIWSYSVIVALGSALIALIMAGEGWLLRACRLPFLRPIGRISYGAYIYHLPLLYLYNILTPTLFPGIPLLGSIIQFGFVYPVTLLTAHLSFRFFEEPVLRLRARFS
jgi:peptidoglycan/LPS O-acetylase OafA/YrhL